MKLINRRPRASARLAKRSFILGSMMLVVSCIAASIFSLSIGQDKRADVIASEKAPLGTWQGKIEEWGDIPAVTLTVKVDGSKLAGTVVFPAVIRTDAGPKVVSKDGLPLIDPKFDGKTLSFKIKVDDPKAARVWEMKLVNENEAELKAVDDKAVEARTVKMTREKY